MRTIHAIFRDGAIEPVEPLDLPENTPLRIALLDEDDLPVEGIAELAHAGTAFEFLNDPREDLYSESDGEAV